MFLAIEAGLVVLALALALTVPNLGSRWFATLERTFGNLAQCRWIARSCTQARTRRAIDSSFAFHGCRRHLSLRRMGKP
jgi:hypothetical protein